jgi:hypothetical protein
MSEVAWTGDDVNGAAPCEPALPKFVHDMIDSEYRKLERKIFQLDEIQGALTEILTKITWHRLDHDTAMAIAFLRAHGYRVSKLRAKIKREQSNGQLTLDVNGKEQPVLNAIGKPFSASYSANYRMTHKPPRLPRRRFRPRTYRSRDIRFEQGE